MQRRGRIGQVAPVMGLTPCQLALLCQLAALEPPRQVLDRVGRGLTAGELARALYLNPPCTGLSKEEMYALEQIENCRSLSGLLVKAYENQNHTTGFVAWAFQARGYRILAFRGSESAPCAPSNVDWADNFLSPFRGSVQYPAVAAFAEEMREAGPLLFTGHSKGGHNALYALAARGKEGDRCICFDAQGFAPGQLTGEMEARLIRQGINYVQRRDVVGALLYHPEKRVFVKAASSGAHPHSLWALAFGLSGTPVPGKRSLVSYLAEGASRALVGLLAREPEKGLQSPQTS